MVALRGMLAGVLSAAALSVSSAQAQDSGDLAQQAPIANLISVPFQNNTNFNVGPFDKEQNILNIQPVIPFKLNEEWNLVTRWTATSTYPRCMTSTSSSAISTT